VILIRHLAPAVKQLLDTVQQLLPQTATNQIFTLASATPFGSSTNGPRVICLQFPSATDEHAAFTASQKHGSEHIYPDLDLITLQQQRRPSVSLTHKQLKQDSF